MNDEEYLFHATVKERKDVARSARNRRGHTGKGGAVKLPSDFRTKKEIEKMNGECRSFNVNEPMTWAEFKLMPDDLKREWILNLRARFGCSLSKMADVLGIHKAPFCKEAKRIGISPSRKGLVFDEKGFYEWSGLKTEDKVVELFPQEVPGENVPVPCVEPVRVYPSAGNMVFEGTCEEVLMAVSALLGGAKVHMSITWDVLED